MATRNERKRRAKLRALELRAAVDAAFELDAKERMERDRHITALQELNATSAGSTNSGENVVARHGPIVRIQT